jgi:ABC-type amino acid transport substrate-binding protein
VTWEFEERRIPDLFTGLSDGSLDAALSALTITAEREKQIDFTHPYFQSGLGIAVSRRSEGGWWAVARRLVSADLLRMLGLLLILLFGTGVLVWFFERRTNREQFGGGLARGLGSGFWWSAVTMTTVGYGDKAPRTLAGRLVGFVWMFACVVFLSGLTASIASALTVSRLESVVTGPQDLPRVRVATVSGTTSEAYLKSRRIASTALPTAADALDALAAGRVEAVVYDKPLLEWTVNGQYEDRLFVLPVSFRPESYAIALPTGSALMERLNVLIPEVTAGDGWSDIVFRHLKR